MGKADVVKILKPELQAMGFVYRENMFQWTETSEQCLHLIIFVQKNAHGDTYKIGLSILIRSPLLSAPRWRVFLSAHVLTERICFHAPSEIWWPSAGVPEAVAALKRDALPWFRKWRSPALLLGKLETSIEQRKSLIDVIEPPGSEREEVLHNTWPKVLGGPLAVPVISYFSASVLHYLVGNKEMAIRRTEDWLNRLSPGDRWERAEVLEQLSTLMQK